MRAHTLAFRILAGRAHGPTVRKQLERSEAMKRWIILEVAIASVLVADFGRLKAPGARAAARVGGAFELLDTAAGIPEGAR